MRRLHLFEFGDLPWFPQVLRDAETAYLAASYRVLPALARGWAEKIATVLDHGHPAEIVDLCSGSGGPMPQILDELEKRGYTVRAILTDLRPNARPASHPRIEWFQAPVDATRVPVALTGVRTMFSAFHHFRPEAARAILKDAFDSRRTICIFESGSEKIAAVASMVGVPIAVLLLMPSARPFRWAYAAFTYLIPILPIIVLWDGMVSLRRIYSPKEMRRLIDGLSAPDYAWEIGRIPLRGLPGGLPYLIGKPLPGEPA
jgi:hypothetical protein